MPNVVRHKRSSTPGAVPLAASLVTGELAINTADGVVYTKKEDGSVASIGGGQALSYRSDFSGSDSYIGVAAAGASESATVWTIRRSTFASNGSVSVAGTATGVSWSGRLSATYS